MVKRKNIALCIFLTIITLGIYMFYWIVCLTNDINKITDTDGTPGWLCLIYFIISLGLYGIYWAYIQGKKLDDLKMSYNAANSELRYIYLCLFVCRLGIILYPLMQHAINEYAYD